MAITASIFSDFWNDQLVAHDRQWVFMVLLGLILSFGFIRLSTRLMRSPRAPWWPGSIVSEGGVHLHHLVFGIVLMMAAGTISFAGFAVSPIYEICAFAFGIGIGLTIDEFALWVHLDDVYWAKEGRSSVDAAVIASALMGLVIVGVRPFEVETGSAEAIIATILGAGLSVGVVVICFLKGRLLHGVLGFLVSPLAIYGACRIGKPDSAWARRVYGDRNPKKQRKSELRFRPQRRTERIKERARDAIGGVTGAEYEARHPAPADDDEQQP
ncbi:MAG: hypothetical protein ABI726_03590 [bacterium]